MTGTTGSVRLRGACAHYLNTHFVKDVSRPQLEVKPEHIIMGTGLIAMLSVVARIVCNPGDGILICCPILQWFRFLQVFQYPSNSCHSSDRQDRHSRRS
jgi:histidinol-phosphate/aromatic aminotransferase/cobyric acid decarboxylase-like protein